MTDAIALAEIIKNPEALEESKKEFENLSKMAEGFHDTYMWKQLIQRGKQNKDEGQYHVALILFRLVSKSLKVSKEIAGSSVAKVQHSVGKLLEISREIDDNEFIQNYIIPSMREVVDDLYHTPGANYGDCL